ncbi:MAG: hypothetical protein WAT67_10250 [Candidatus Contendobacter sp.]
MSLTSGTNTTGNTLFVHHALDILVQHTQVLGAVPQRPPSTHTWSGPTRHQKTVG